MFYKIRIVADVLECDAYRFVLFHIFPVMNNVYFHRKDNKCSYYLPFPTKCRTIRTSLRTNGL